MPWNPPGWDPPPLVASVAAAVPNPVETVWTYGTSGATWDGRLVAGFDLNVRGAIRAGGSAVTYDPSDALDAYAWRGGDEAPVLIPGVSWSTASAGTFTLAVPAVATARLDPGSYRLQVGVTAATVRSLVFDGDLQILAAPGSGTLRVPYATARDLCDFYAQIGQLQSRSDDATFLRQRAAASDEFDLQLDRRYEPTAGMVLTRHDTPHPILGVLDYHDPASAWPTHAELLAAIHAGGVIVDEAVREMAAKLALARILGQQQAGSGRNSYAEEAEAYRRDVARLWAAYLIQVDTDGDGVADILIGRDIILLPPGTSP